MDLFSGLLGVGELIASIGSGRKARRQQMKLQKKAWQREDNAVRRRVADLKAAGLSPLLAAGDAAQSSPPIIASKGIEQEQQGVEKGLEAAKIGIDMMLAKKQIARSDAEIRLLNEERRSKKIENDAQESEYLMPTHTAKGWEYQQTGKTVANAIAQAKATGDLTSSAINYWKMQAEEYGVDQAAYDAWKARVKMTDPTLSEPRLELAALSAAVQAQEMANQMQQQNVEFFKRTGIPPQIAGALIGIAGQTLPHGLYKIP